jgi:hypothetical protein
MGIWRFQGTRAQFWMWSGPFTAEACGRLATTPVRQRKSAGRVVLRGLCYDFSLAIVVYGSQDHRDSRWFLFLALEKLLM